MTRNITEVVPKYYKAQVQVLLEILDLQRAHFVQYRPETAWSPMELQVTVMDRDPAWFATRLPLMQSFTDEMHSRIKRITENPECAAKEIQEIQSQRKQPKKRQFTAPKKVQIPSEPLFECTFEC